MTDQIVIELLYSAGGLALGFVIGYVVRGMVLRRAPQAEVGTAGTPPQRTVAGTARRHRRDLVEQVGRPLLGIVMIVLVIYTVLAANDATRKLHDLAVSTPRSAPTSAKPWPRAARHRRRSPAPVTTTPPPSRPSSGSSPTRAPHPRSAAKRSGPTTWPCRSTVPRSPPRPLRKTPIRWPLVIVGVPDR